MTCLFNPIEGQKYKHEPANRLMKTRKLLTNLAVLDLESLVKRRIMTLLAFAGVSWAKLIVEIRDCIK